MVFAVWHTLHSMTVPECPCSCVDGTLSLALTMAFGSIACVEPWEVQPGLRLLASLLRQCSRLMRG